MGFIITGVYKGERSLCKLAGDTPKLANETLEECKKDDCFKDYTDFRIEEREDCDSWFD